MFSTEDLKTAIGATVIARRNAAARLREAGNPRDPFRALPGMEQQFFEAALGFAAALLLMRCPVPAVSVTAFIGVAVSLGWAVIRK